jgi:hypothetical protein
MKSPLFLRLNTRPDCSDAASSCRSSSTDTKQSIPPVHRPGQPPMRHQQQEHAPDSPMIAITPPGRSFETAPLLYLRFDAHLPSSWRGDWLPSPLHISCNVAPVGVKWSAFRGRARALGANRLGYALHAPDSVAAHDLGHRPFRAAHRRNPPAATGSFETARRSKCARRTSLTGSALYFRRSQNAHGYHGPQGQRIA